MLEMPRSAVCLPGSSPRAILVARAPLEPRLVNKKQRHAAIVDLVRSQAVASQEELRGLLKERGWDVTQSTLSRDLRELRLARLPTPDGSRYAFPEARADDHRALLDDLLPQFFASCEGVGELLVIKTIPGGAQPIAEAIDAEGFADVLGTIGGENTILVICRSAAARERLERRVQRLAREG
jgi:transcriptional regulator of arginine metabolism